MFLSEGSLVRCQSDLARSFCVIGLQAKERIEKGFECSLEDFIMEEF